MLLDCSFAITGLIIVLDWVIPTRLKIQDEGLKRVIGVRSLASNAVNLTIGAGIFALPAIVAAQMGSSAIWAYLLCGLLLSLVLLCFVEVGTKITNTGGSYAYVEKAFGPFAGFLTNSLYWMGFATLSTAAIANVIMDNLAVFVPSLSEPFYRGILLALVIGGLAALNVIGVKESSRFITAVTLLKVIPLVLLIVVGIFYVESNNFNSASSFTISKLGETALILFFAFGGGAECVLCATGEIKDPKRTIPRGLLLGILIVLMIYFLIQLISQGVLGSALALQKEAPLAAVADKIVGGYGMLLMVAGAAFSSFGTMSGDMMVSSRMPYAAARDGLLPSYLAKLHPKFSTPYRSIIFYALIVFLFSISGGFRQLAIMSSASLLLIYVGVIAATIRLRKLKSEDAFIIPGGITIPVLALGATGWFLSHLTQEEIAAAALFLILFTMIYFLIKIIQKKSLSAKE
jgi:amino acid transporter